LVLVLAGLSVVLAGGAVALWPQRSSRITRENCTRIRKGMTPAEVESVLGPPGDYRTRLGETNVTEDPQDWLLDLDEFDPVVATWSENPIELHREAVWLGDTLQLLVVLDDTGHVLEAWTSERRANGHALDNLCWQVRHQWYR
jgi:hypothetical protein